MNSTFHRVFYCAGFLFLIALLGGPLACKKDETPTAPPPANTSTATPSGTPTATRTMTPTHTLTPTVTAWCPGSGTTGQSSVCDIISFNGDHTHALRIQLGAAVTITHIGFRGNNTGSSVRLGVYSDDGTGASPVNLLNDAIFTDNTAGWVNVPIGNVAAGPGYVWLALTGVGAGSDVYSGACNTGMRTAFATGQFPNPITSLVFSDIDPDPALIALWTCP